MKKILAAIPITPRLAVVGTMMIAGGSLIAALLFQHVGGLQPCALCYPQRWAHALIVVAGAAWLVYPGRLTALAGALSALHSIGQAARHAGVERHWWPGPQDCSGPSAVGEMDPAALLDRIMAAPVVRCDEVAWSLLGLSMADWNVIVSTLILLLWAPALRRAFGAGG
ncbi:disulfide bond formation protein B (plasmid) [Cereibacter azotoformans]|uniref:disulfide bond formation protein B n=1 Tax=Cereibacter azotoformans TaxID=43057 RepID=UPI001EEA7F1B|nr:disulfide bond formation protein B [Cereibacter azotoformans]ULB12484.1 disulfide bond formation protein B [Cereibacter azotoformans]